MYSVIIQNPFEKSEQKFITSSSQEVFAHFQSIDWGKLNAEIYDRHDDVIHDFYFFEVEQMINGKKYILNLSAEFDSKIKLSNQELLYTIHYRFPDPNNEKKTLHFESHDESRQFVDESLQAFTQNNSFFLFENFEKHEIKHQKTGKGFKIFLLFFLSLIVLSLVFIQFAVGWSHVPEHFASLKEWISPNNTDDVAEAEIAQDTVEITDVVACAPEVLLDTVMWNNALKNGDYIPENVLEDMKRAKAFDYSKMVAAEDFPTDQEAQFAIVHQYGQDAIKLLKDNQAHIKIGKAYEAETRGSDELVRVSAEICGFNDKGVNLMNISMPIENAYDFVKYQNDPSTWYIQDLSQTIPYDYQLNK